MRSRLERLQTELENTNKRIEQIQRGSGYGARANRVMNFGSDYSGGSRNSSNRRQEYSGSAKRNTSNSRYVSPTGDKSIPKPRQGISGDRSGSKGRSTYVPIHLRG